MYLLSEEKKSSALFESLTNEIISQIKVADEN
jgi:hypothetical protein